MYTWIVYVYMNFGEQIWCILSEEMSFEIFTPIWSYVNEKRKKENVKNPKFEISQFFDEQLETRHRSMHEFCGVNLLCTLRGDVVWSFFSSIWSQVNENEKKKSVKKNKIEKNWCGGMVDRYLSLKFRSD